VVADGCVAAVVGPPLVVVVADGSVAVVVGPPLVVVVADGCFVVDVAGWVVLGVLGSGFWPRWFWSSTTAPATDARTSNTTTTRSHQRNGRSSTSLPIGTALPGRPETPRVASSAMKASTRSPIGGLPEAKFVTLLQLPMVWSVGWASRKNPGWLRGEAATGAESDRRRSLVIWSVQGGL
jgi:hypothetical protein